MCPFLRRWEMNDFLFLLLVENLKPATATEASQQAWFAITPDTWRAGVLACAGNWLPAESSRAAFLLARTLTTTVFLSILIALVWRVRKSADPADWLRAGFLILAWFWLLSPTQTRIRPIRQPKIRREVRERPAQGPVNAGRAACRRGEQ